LARKARTVDEKTATALQDVRLAAQGGRVFRSAALQGYATLEVLRTGGWVLELTRGWYTLTTPQASPEDAAPLLANYWEFVAKFLGDRLGNAYVLAPFHSLALHSGLPAIPRQLIAKTSRATQNRIQLPGSFSIYVSHDPAFDNTETVEVEGIRILSLERALARLSASAYREPPPEVIKAIRTSLDIAALVRALLVANNPTSAGHVIAALRDVGRTHEAESLARDLAADGLVTRDFDKRDLSVADRPSSKGSSSSRDYLASLAR
jgi:hypothetical protein